MCMTLTKKKEINLLIISLVNDDDNPCDFLANLINSQFKCHIFNLSWALHPSFSFSTQWDKESDITANSLL